SGTPSGTRRAPQRPTRTAASSSTSGVRSPPLAEAPLVAGLRIGHAHDAAAATGCTVLLGPFRCVAEVRGMATGTRELHALSPLHLAPRADAIVLTGGSAYGLAAADGVMRWLEARGGGFATAAGVVPIVPAA